MRVLDYINKLAVIILTVAASFCLIFMMGIVVADVILRAVNPEWRIFGTLDYVEFSLDWLVFLAIPLALFSGQIITVDLIDNIDRKGVLRVLGGIATLLALGLMLSQIIRPALDVLDWGEVTFDLGILKFYYWLAIWVGIGLSVLAIASRTILLFRSAS